MNIILASRSERRKKILEQMGLTFSVIPSGFQEDLNSASKPAELVKELALGKARDVAARHQGLIIGADTLVVFQGRIIGKPKDEEDARKTLQMLSGKTHEVYTGIAVVDSVHGKEAVDFDAARVTFREITTAETDAFIKAVAIMGYAGSYSIEHPLCRPWLAALKGDSETVTGLPSKKLEKMLLAFTA